MKIMPTSMQSSMLPMLYRLGTWYTAYRFLIGICLAVVFIFTFRQLNNHYEQPFLYFLTLIVYSLISLMQLLAFRWLPSAINSQLVVLFLADVVCFSTLTFAAGGPNLHLSLLFVITIFSASILLDKHKALIVTLIAVISVVYQHFVGSLLAYTNLNNITNSALLAFLFFVVYAIGQMAVQHFKLLENLNLHQSIELHRLQNINRYILEQIDMGYLVLDENDQIVLSNPAACALLGIPALFAYEQYPLIKLQPNLFHELKSVKLVDGLRFEFTASSKYQIQVQVKSLIAPQQALTLLILQDTQKLRQHVQQLKLAALGQLTASIAHEIRNPLAAISQANELLRDSDAEQQRFLTDMIERQSQRINTIIEDTLAMARNRQTTPTPLLVNQLLPDLLEQDLNDVKTRIFLDFEAESEIYFDEIQFRQVLINLIRNALRYNPADQQIHIRSQRQGNVIYLDVIDFGQGVAKQDIAQLFTPFFSTEINGTGLGLYLSHSFCEANKARLTYVEQEKGACFRIECPTT